MRGAAALAALLLLAGCRKDDAQPRRRAPRPVAVAPVGGAQPETTQPDDTDATWLFGTWQKSSAKEWLLFNPPDQVALLAGKPATLKVRGKFVLHGKYLTLLLPQPTGITAERYLDVARDHSRLNEGKGTDQATAWERGAPPP